MASDSSIARMGNAPQGTKLRNSCDACAIAKIKCTQEKPMCMYCVKRLKECVYRASKRVRRSTRAGGHKAREDAVSKAMGPAMTPAAAAATTLASSGWHSSLGSVTSTSTDFNTSARASSLTTPLPSQDWPDILTNVVFPALTTSPTETPFSTDWADLGSSIDSFSYLDNDSAFDFSIPLSDFEQNNTPCRGNVVNFSVCDRGVAAISTNDNTISSTAKSSSSLSRDCLTENQNNASFNLLSSPRAYCSSTVITPVPPSNCFMRTTRFLEQLSMDPCEAWTIPDNGVTSTHKPNVGQIHKQIEDMSTAINNVLQCSCSNNSDLLVLLSLVIFRIQAWYAAAVNAMASGKYDPEVMTIPKSNATPVSPKIVGPPVSADLDGESPEGEDQRRIFIQHILSRLTVLQILVSRLSQRLTNGEVDSCPSETLMQAAKSPSHAGMEGTISVLPFSGILLRALSSDLRNRLAALSRGIAEKLRVS